MPRLSHLDLSFVALDSVSAASLVASLPSLTVLTHVSLGGGSKSYAAPAIAALSACSALRTLELPSHEVDRAQSHRLPLPCVLALHVLSVRLCEA